MPRITPLSYTEASAAVKNAYTLHTEKYRARITNMKSTLAHFLPAFEVYMQWYVLFEELEKLLGNRLATYYAHAVSYATDCPLCSTFFRKIIIEAGEDPQNLSITPEEQQLLSFGSAIAQSKGHISDELYLSVSKRFTDQQMVLLIAFAGQMIATNVFSNVIETQIDEYLVPFVNRTTSIR